MEKRENETRLSFLKRVTIAYSDKLIDAQEWAHSILGSEYLNVYSDEYVRRAFTFFKIFLDKGEEEDIEILSADKRVEEIRKAQDDLIRERKRLQTVNAELQETYRFQARNELFNERILEAIENLQPIEVKRYKVSRPPINTGLMLISDLHYGSNYEIKGLFGEVINAYSEEICKERLWNLISQVEADCMDYDSLVIGCLGDVIENILRTSSLTKLRKPVIDSVIEVSELLSQWLVECYDRLQVPIKFCFVGGNHDIARLLTEKPQFDEENYGKLILKFIELRLAGHEMIKVEPYSDACFQTIHSSNVLFSHGVNNLAEIVEYYENVSNVTIDTIYGGHLHRPDSKTVSMSDLGDKETIRIGSICGGDTFSKKLLKSARPSAYFAIYNDDGKGWSRNYYL